MGVSEARRQERVFRRLRNCASVAAPAVVRRRNRLRHRRTAVIHRPRRSRQAAAATALAAAPSCNCRHNSLVKGALWIMAIIK